MIEHVTSASGIVAQILLSCIITYMLRSILTGITPNQVENSKSFTKRNNKKMEIQMKFISSKFISYINPS
jgi:hypothetical protein